MPRDEALSGPKAASCVHSGQNRGPKCWSSTLEPPDSLRLFSSPDSADFVSTALRLCCLCLRDIPAAVQESVFLLDFQALPSGPRCYTGPTRLFRAHTWSLARAREGSIEQRLLSGLCPEPVPVNLSRVQAVWGLKS